MSLNPRGSDDVIPARIELATCGLGNSQRQAEDVATTCSAGQNNAESTQLPHTLTTPSHSSTVGGDAPELNARPRWHGCLFPASMAARPSRRYFCSGLRAVKSTGATRGAHVGPGVYFLMKGGRLLYIGQSKNVANRMLGHSSKRADEVWSLSVAVENLLLAESNFIALLLPPMNKRIDDYPLDWVFTRRAELGIATSAEKASLELPEAFLVGDAPEVFGAELRRNRRLFADRWTTRGEAQRYLNDVRRSFFRTEAAQ